MAFDNEHNEHDQGEQGGTDPFDADTEEDGCELLATGVWTEHGVVPAVVRIARPKPLPALPPVDLGRCQGTRDCLAGECYCGDPFTGDYLFPGGDGPKNWNNYWED